MMTIIRNVRISLLFSKLNNQCCCVYVAAKSIVVSKNDNNDNNDEEIEDVVSINENISKLDAHDGLEPERIACEVGLLFFKIQINFF
jgi:hypothetical protein